MSIITCEAIAATIFLTCKALTYDLYCKGLSGCWNELRYPLLTACAALAAFVAALASPVVNLVDLMGGAMSTIKGNNQTPVYQ